MTTDNNSSPSEQDQEKFFVRPQPFQVIQFEHPYRQDPIGIVAPDASQYVPIEGGRYNPFRFIEDPEGLIVPVTSLNGSDGYFQAHLALDISDIDFPDRWSTVEVTVLSPDNILKTARETKSRAAYLLTATMEMMGQERIN